MDGRTVLKSSRALPSHHRPPVRQAIRPSVHPCKAGDGTRTRDPQLGRLMLYQLSYTRKIGRPRIRLFSPSPTVRRSARPTTVVGVGFEPT